MKIKIADKYNGPNHSGNGGYVCGLIDSHAPFTISEVTLKLPTPLNKELLVYYEPQRVSLLDGNHIIGYAREGQLDINIPIPPDYLEASRAAQNYIGTAEHHFFPHCFVCGPHRKSGDGLRIFPGRVAHTDLFAAPWIPDGHLGDASGKVRKEYLWSALDCPGAFALMGEAMHPMVLGRMTCKHNPQAYIEIGEQCVVTAWPMGREGRKLYCGTAIFNQNREWVAVAKAIWISVDLKEFNAKVN